MDTINYHNASVLFADSDKNEYLDKTGFYHLPQSIMKKLNNKLGNSSAQLRIMIVLIGTKPGFHPSAAWLRDQTGVSRTSCYDSINALIERGFLSRSKDGEQLIINYKKIME